MKKTLGVILVLPLVLFFGLRIYKDITFGIDCGGHIKRAADANTVELAIQEMKTVVDYLEANKMTGGYTSVIYPTPDEDVGFWYTNLKDSLGELKAVKPDATQLEKSNLLMKLRETLLDHKEKGGDDITAPDGISVFPNNLGYTLFGFFSTIVAIVGALFFVMGLDED